MNEQLLLIEEGLTGALRRREEWAIALAQKAMRANEKAGYRCMSITPEAEALLAEIEATS